MSFEAARDFGDVWTLTELWNSLGFDRLRQVFGRTRHAIDVEALIRIMVLNRLLRSGLRSACCAGYAPGR